MLNQVLGKVRMTLDPRHLLIITRISPRNFNLQVSNDMTTPDIRRKRRRVQGLTRKQHVRDAQKKMGLLPSDLNLSRKSSLFSCANFEIECPFFPLGRPCPDPSPPQKHPMQVPFPLLERVVLLPRKMGSWGREVPVPEEEWGGHGGRRCAKSVGIQDERGGENE